MALMNDAHNESDKLVQRLAGLQYIVDTNLPILDKDRATREFLAFKMEIALSYIEEYQVWKTLGNQDKCNSAIANAQFFLEQAQVLMDRILDQYCEDAWLDFQKELKFTQYASSNYNYILRDHTKSCPRTVAG